VNCDCHLQWRHLQWHYLVVPVSGFTPLLKSFVCLEAEAFKSHQSFSSSLKPNALVQHERLPHTPPQICARSASIMEKERQNNDMIVHSSNCCPCPQQGLLRQAAKKSLSWVYREKGPEKHHLNS